MDKQMRIPLYEALREHVNKRPVSFHVPGHKYGSIPPTESPELFEQILKIDATELTGLDDLHSPEGAILEAELLLADVYQTKRSFFLVGGSTVGNLAMVMAACTEGSTVLVQRNCHKSVFNALKLAKVRPIFLEPEVNQEWKAAAGVSLETLAQALKFYSKVRAIILTYPNYYGLTYDLEAIIHLAHLHHIPILVDEAHGAHFIYDSFPKSALQLGADLVVHSAHKTLPAMTMGSYLHVKSDLVDLEMVKGYLETFQSSSPSYPIMASLDIARNYIATYGKRDYSFLQMEINRFKTKLASVVAIKVLDASEFQIDSLKLTIQSRCGLTGFELQRRFEEFGVYTELADPYNVLFILPLLKEGQWYPFDEAAEKIKSALNGLPVCKVIEECYMGGQKITELAVAYHEMSRLAVNDTAIEKAAGAVCAETIIPYPPGIPLLVKGERITEVKLAQLHHLSQTGTRFQGGSLLKNGRLKTFSI